MLNIKILLFLVLLFSTVLNAQVLQTSNNLSNLEVVTDAACEKRSVNANTQTPEVELEVVPKTQDVETVNYTLHDCNGLASFPVTVRSNKRQGE